VPNIAAGGGYAQGHLACPGHHQRYRSLDLGHPLPAHGRGQNGRRVTLAKERGARRFDHVDLVEDDDQRDLGCAEVAKHFLHRAHALVHGLHALCVNDVQQEVRIPYDLEGRTESGDQLVRKVSYEPDGVGYDYDSPLRELEPARGGVERAEELVLDQDARPGQPIEERGLSAVGVADEAHLTDAGPHPALSLGQPDSLHLREVPLELVDALSDPAPVHLELRLSGPSPRADATGHPRHLEAEASYPREQVRVLRQLDLGPALGRVRVLREDVEYESGAVDHPGVEDIGQPVLLGDREPVVEDDERRACLLSGALDLFDLAAAEDRGRIVSLPPLAYGGDDVCAGRAGERLQLREGFSGLHVGHGRQLN